MPRSTTHPDHWLVAAGETWTVIANATHISKAALAACNADAGYTYNGSTFNRQPGVGVMLHLPFQP